jgi:lactoylglutathione lyase
VKLAHIALWTNDLDASSSFWRDYFSAAISALYRSRRQQGFTSRFATLPGGLQLELMSAPWVEGGAAQDHLGWAHVALSLESTDAVDAAAGRFAAAGLLVSAPRRTGDGFYETVVQTPEGTLIEIVA